MRLRNKSYLFRKFKRRKCILLSRLRNCNRHVESVYGRQLSRSMIYDTYISISMSMTKISRVLSCAKLNRIDSCRLTKEDLVRDI